MELYVSGVLNIQPAALNATRKVPFPVIRENPSAFDFLVDPQVIYEYLRKDDTSLPDLPTPFSSKDLVALKERLGKNEYAALLICSPPSVLDQLWLQRPGVFAKRRSVSFVFVRLRFASVTAIVYVYALLLSSFMHYYCHR